MEQRETKVTQFLKRYKGMLAGAILLMLFQVMGTLYIPTLMSSIVNKGILEGNLSYIYRTGGIMLGIALGTAAVSLMGSWLACTIAGRFCRDIREKLFEHIQKYSTSDFQKFGTASVVTRTTNDLALMQDMVAISLQLVLPGPLIALGALTLAFKKSPSMAALIIVMIGAFIVIAGILCIKALPFYEVLRKGMDAMNRILRERISGVRVIRAFHKEDYEQKRMDHIFDEYSATSIKVNKVFAVMMPLVLGISNFCVLCILILGGRVVTAGGMQIGDIMALIEYAMLIFWNLVMAVMMLMMLPRGKACADRIRELLEVEPEIQDGKEHLSSKTENVVLQFTDVEFCYEDAEEPVLYGLNFSCQKGQTTAIIGGTGSGKSTIASLMMRFYDIKRGSIRLYGRDIRSISQKQLRDCVGYVPQKAFLFSGTIEENLKYGNQSATEEDMKKAAAIAQAEEFIQLSEDGMQSYVAQGGTNYSGGQRQRLSIARALTKKADLYIFDDSFSALDYKTDANLRRALKKDVKDAAIVVVAQRVSSIIDADQIIVLDKGRVAGMGKHEELMENCEIYREIVKSQRKGESA